MQIVLEILGMLLVPFCMVIIAIVSFTPGQKFADIFGGGASGVFKKRQKRSKSNAFMERVDEDVLKDRDRRASFGP